MTFLAELFEYLADLNEGLVDAHSPKGSAERSIFGDFPSIASSADRETRSSAASLVDVDSGSNHKARMGPVVPLKIRRSVELDGICIEPSRSQEMCYIIRVGTSDARKRLSDIQVHKGSAKIVNAVSAGKNKILSSFDTCLWQCPLG